MTMKHNILILASLALSISAVAQPKPEVTNPLERPYETHEDRTEIIIPMVNGLNVYKTDFHMHTIYSDGEVTPSMRVVEAWYDGLDAIAITDHMEYRRIERDELFDYMNKYIRPEIREAVNTNIMRQGPDEHGVLVDFNVAYKTAVQKASNYGLLVIRGVEITRKKKGDYNAIFTTDNNAIYSPSLEQTIRNARSQGAFIVHNHPDYDPKSPNYLTSTPNDLYAKGLIDGVEVANSRKIYWHLFNHAISGGYTPMANSDNHEFIYWKYGRPSDYDIPRYRNMNLILAKSLTANDLRDALRAGNTIAYSNNNLISKCELLKALFEASVEFKIQRTASTRHHVTVVNRSSLPYYFQIGNKEYILNAMGALHFNLPKDVENITVTVLNMWYGNNEHPTIDFELK